MGNTLTPEEKLITFAKEVDTMLKYQKESRVRELTKRAMQPTIL